MKYENIKKYKASEFKNLTGVSPKTFEAMVEILKKAYAQRHSRRGRHRKLSVEDMLLLTLEYYREYRTLLHLGASFGLQKSNVGRIIHWVEEALIQSGEFSLPSKRKLAESTCEFEVIVVDTTEIPIQRPTKHQKDYYSGKKNGIQ